MEKTKVDVLIVVDMQNDFVTGALGTPEAQAIVPKVVEKIKNWKGEILYTRIRIMTTTSKLRKANIFL